MNASSSRRSPRRRHHDQWLRCHQRRHRGPLDYSSLTNSFVGYSATAADAGFQPLLSAAPGAGEIAYSDIVSGALTAGLLSGNDIADLTTAAKTLVDNPSLYALRTNQNISPTASFNTITLTSGGLIMTGGTINPLGAVTAGAMAPMTLNFGSGGSGEALIYIGTATSNIQAQLDAAQGLTKMGTDQLNLLAINPGIGAPVVINEGTLLVRAPVAASGSAIGTALNGQDVILNAGALVITPQLANTAGNATEIASNATVTGNLGRSVFVRGDATLSNNGAGQYAQINDLTIANDSNAPAMTGNSTITLNLQSGVWVAGTTSTLPSGAHQRHLQRLLPKHAAGPVVGVGGVIEKFGNGAITLLNTANTFSGGVIVHGTTAGTAASTVASGARGTGTPFGSGSITVNPGGVLRASPTTPTSPAMR